MTLEVFYALDAHGRRMAHYSLVSETSTWLTWCDLAGAQRGQVSRWRGYALLDSMRSLRFTHAVPSVH